jgi:pimeloyl-ACP methyl ester carboxylesterase
MTFSRHMISVNDIQLHHVIGGRGDPVVLLHGWPETWYGRRHVMPALAKNHTVIVPDLRGLGDSSKPVTGYDGKTTAQDIYQLVSQLGFKDVFLVGHDFGAQVAYSYAAAHSNQVKRLVILDFAIPGMAQGKILQAYGGLNFTWCGISQKCLLRDMKMNTLLGSIDTLVILQQLRNKILMNMLVTILRLVECEQDLNTIGLC